MTFPEAVNKLAGIAADVLEIVKEHPEIADDIVRTVALIVQAHAAGRSPAKP